MERFLRLLGELEPLGVLALAKTLGVQLGTSKGVDNRGEGFRETESPSEPDTDSSCGELSLYRTTSDSGKTLRDTRADGAAEDASPENGCSGAPAKLAPRDGAAVLRDIIDAYSHLSRSQRRAIERDLKTIIRRQKSK